MKTESVKRRIRRLIGVVTALLLTAAIMAAPGGTYCSEVGFGNAIVAEAADVVIAFRDSKFTYDIVCNDAGEEIGVRISEYFGTDSEVEIPKTSSYKGNVYPVISIGYGAFSNCTNITSVTIPEGITSIGICAFENCSSITNIIISESVTYIGQSAFYGCSSLKNIIIPENVTYIGQSAFYGCSSLESIVIPEKVTSIATDTFHDCSSLKSITIPNGVTSIGDTAFQSCSKLTSIIIPESVTSIGEYAFRSCVKLEMTIFEGDVPACGTDVFKFVDIFCSNAKIYVPADKLDAYKTAYGLSTYANMMVGYECCGDTSENNGKNVKYTMKSDPENEGKYIVTIFGIGAMTDDEQSASPFENNSISKVIIKSGVTSIGKFAFSCCTSLTSITIPDSVTSIGECAFSDCTSLTNIEVEEGNENYTSIDGVLFSKEKTALVAYPPAKEGTSYDIPNGVTSIDISAFSRCSKLTSITIPESVTEISETAFEGCTDIIIYGAAGSYAEKYAEANGISFNFRIDKAPSDTEVIEGLSAELSISASGTELSYRWQELTEDGWTDISGASDAVLVIDTVTAEGQFRCIVTDKNGMQLISDSAVLSVIPAEKVTAEMVGALTTEQCIDFVNCFTGKYAQSDSSEMLLTEAQIEAIRRVLQYDYDKAQ